MLSMKRIIVLLIVTLIASSCKKKQTIWESDWSSPLISDTLSLDKLVNDSTFSENAGFYELDLNRTLFDLNISELIVIPDTTIKNTFSFSATLPVSAGTDFVNNVEENDMNVQDVQLKNIILKSGFIDIRVENPLPTIAIFTFTLPGVQKNGVTFTQVYFAPAASGSVPGVVTETIDLTDSEIDLTGISGGDYNLLRSQINVKSDPSGPDITITPSDITKIDATFRDVKVNYARGYFGNKIVSDTTELLIDALDAISSGTADLPASVIQFHIENGIKVSGQMSLTSVSNENSSGNVVNLSGANIGTNFNMDAATGSWNTLTPSQKVIEFNGTNSNIETYLENLGKKHKVGYSMQMNPWGNVSGSWDEVFPNSKLSIRMTATMPLAIGLENLQLKDTFAISLNQDSDKTRIKSGDIILQASNAFPVSAEIILHLLDENGTVLHSVIGSSILESSLTGSMDANTGLLAANSELQFVLSEDVLNDINDVKSIIVDTRFNSINPVTNIVEQQSIPFGAFLAIKLKTKFTTENKF